MSSVQMSGLKDAALKLVSTAFVMPALSSMHESPLGPSRGPFAPGPAEKRFAPLLHQYWADNISASANFTLAQSIVDRFESTGPTE